MKTFFDLKICEWLSEHTDLSLIIWTNQLAWSSNGDGGRNRRAIDRFSRRSKRLGVIRAANEMLYYALYRTYAGKEELTKIKEAVAGLNFAPKKGDRTDPTEEAG